MSTFSINTPPPPVCVNNYYYSTSYTQFFNTNFLSLRGAKRRANRGILSESGRSLVEMLGVLAIMGILTIGGITGFNYAMNKQRANATVEYVNELAVLGTGQMLAGGTPKLLDYPKQTPSGYAADITTDDNKPNAFYIEIDKVPTPVCNEIISRLDGWKMVNDIGFFGKIGTCADAEQVKMWFEITANASKGDTDYHCTTDADCKNQFGSSFVCNARGMCELSCPSGEVKTPVGCCPADRVFNGGCCSKPTSRIEDGKCCHFYYFASEGGERKYCCPAGEFAIPSGECISCDDPRVFQLVSTDIRVDICKVCPQRSVSPWNCLPPNEPCPDGGVRINNKCSCPLDKPVQDKYGNCFPCDGTRSSWPPMISTPPVGLMKYGTSALSFYCNRRTGSGYSDYSACASGTIGLPRGHTILLADGTSYKVTNGPGECKNCDEVATSELKYQAWCESCGGTWSGSSWDNGTCTF